MSVWSTQILCSRAHKKNTLNVKASYQNHVDSVRHLTHAKKIIQHPIAEFTFVCRYWNKEKRENNIWQSDSLFDSSMHESQTITVNLDLWLMLLAF